MSAFALQVIFALCVCVAAGNAAVAIERRHPNAAENSCISSSHALSMKAGDAISLPSKCVQAMCKDNGDIVYYSCGMVGVPDGCKLSEPDLNLPYPDCCSTKVNCSLGVL